jgi:hypothetical protein
MAGDPFTIKIFVPSGDPEGVRIVEQMNWTGKGIMFPRLEWETTRLRQEFQLTGVYILIGQEENFELPSLYIGQSDNLQARLDNHMSKEFWDRAIVFVSSNKSLNRGHLTWLEYALIAKSKEISQCILKNEQIPNEPTLSEAEKADTGGFLKQALQILPLLGVRAFETPRPVVSSNSSTSNGNNPSELNTIVIPANKEGFEDVFLGEDSWYAIRISGGMLPQIRYIAGYQNYPISAITHYAEVERIEPYGDNGKYRLFFANKAKKIGPIPFANAPQGSMQAPRYTSFAKLKSAKTLTDVFK